ncbi:MAG: beta-N-acetylhexosaminidase [Gammaproteobacteria bacterium]|nr:beta-N-acetylhexosaminidase [Gammaproteobacteria bacterium]NNJ49045.1 beta-N-acetylhexosaminidase [Gammaproteobacteria bacterium]
MTLGPLMVDLEGTGISATEKQLLLKPEVGGVILFTRNFESIEQITQLVTEIHALRTPRLLVAVDHEGGRVQRFHEGFSRIPAAASYAKAVKNDLEKSRQLSENAGWLMAIELRACGIDFSFAPVLDLAHGLSGVIGDRAFHSKAATVATLAYAFMHGMNRAGMQAVGKHFPGHGGVVEDSHVAMPVDHRSLEQLLHTDIVPFKSMIENKLAGIMPAHVIYDQVDPMPAGYSSFWIQNILRQRLDFQGAVFSDDLSMEAAGIAGGYGERAEAALKAGCDMALVCNHLDGAVEAAEYIKGYLNPTSQLRLVRMHGEHAVNWAKLKLDKHWQQISEQVVALNESPELEMDV